MALVRGIGLASAMLGGAIYRLFFRTGYRQLTRNRNVLDLGCCTFISITL